MEEAIAAPGGTVATTKLESMRIVTGCRTPEQFVAVFHKFCDAKTCFIPSVDTRPVGSTLAFSLRLLDGTPMLRGTCIVKAAWSTKDNPFKRPGVQLEIKKLTAESEALYEQLLGQKTAVVEAPEHVVNAPSDGIVEVVNTVTTNQHVPRDKAIDLILKGGRAPVVEGVTRIDPSADTELARGSNAAIVTDPEAKLDTSDAKPIVVIVPPRAEAEIATVEMPPLHYLTATRAPGSGIVLPANPLTGFEDGALDALLACTMSVDTGEQASDDDLAIAVSKADRDAIKTTLGVAPLAPVTTHRVKTLPMPRLHVAGTIVKPVVNEGTRPLAFQTRPPASRSLLNLHAMTRDERVWFFYAFGAVLLVAAVVLALALLAT